MSTFSKVSKLPYSGFGNTHKNRWNSPFSALDASSIKFLATPDWMKPLTVSLLDAIMKLASPVTKCAYVQILVQYSKNCMKAYSAIYLKI